MVGHTKTLLRYTPHIFSLILLAALGYGFTLNLQAAASVTSIKTGNWSDPTTWNTGAVPGQGDAVTIAPATSVTYDTNAAVVSGLNIKGELKFNPAVGNLLQTSGNVVVEGRLVMRPANAGVNHTLRFINVNEAAFVGGLSHDILPSDVGLWVTGAGQLDLAGTSKNSWSRASGSLAAGSRTISLKDSPTGWRGSDEVAIAPTESPAVGEPSWRGFDTSAITGTSGNSVTLASGLTRPHPMVNNTWTAEVMNLTRNVQVEGTPSGRTHIWVSSSRPQTVNYTQIRHIGPRKADGKYTTGITSRYGLHFHESGDGTRGSTVEGTVVRDGGNHAFVAHFSHGITFRKTISFNTFETAYWWDTSPDTRTPGPETNDTLYDEAIAALVKTDPSFRGFRLSGFSLLQGARNTVRNSVAVGVQGNVDANGFQWPESSGVNGHGVWGFSEGNISHNNKVHGIFNWQNSSGNHVLSNFAAYHNGAYGINHGAYTNTFKFNNGILYGNKEGGIILRAVSSSADKRIEFNNMIIDGAGISSWGVQTAEHNTANTNPTVFRYLTVRNVTKAAIHLSYITRTGWDTLNFEYPNFSGNQFYLDNNILTNSIVRVQTDPKSAFQLKRFDQTGTYVAEWNARQTIIPAFTTTPPPPQVIPVTSPSSLIIQNGTVKPPAKPANAPNGTPPNPTTNIPESSDGKILTDDRLPGQAVGSDGTLASASEPATTEKLYSKATPWPIRLLAIATNPRLPWLYLLITLSLIPFAWSIYQYRRRFPISEPTPPNIIYPSK